jgi:hypothetical protein
MARLAQELANLVGSAAALPLDRDAAEALLELPAPALRAIAAQASDLLGAGVGALFVADGIPRAAFPAPLVGVTLSGHPGFAALLADGRSLATGANDADLVRTCQRALQATAARVPGAPRALALPDFGADGDFGAETTAAVIALQQWRGTGGAPGVLGPPEARALREALANTAAPDLFAGSAAPQDPAALPSDSAARLAAIARGICAATGGNPFTRQVRGKTYSYAASHFGETTRFAGRLEAPGGVSYGVRSNAPYWKCNIFGGTCIALAGLPVPTHTLSNGVRHFPRAERFGDALKGRPGWKLVRYLDHRDPSDPTIARRGPRETEEVGALLREMVPGDVFFVDHPGEPGNNGGHTRICVEPAGADDPDAAPAFAQARQHAAAIERNGVSYLTGTRGEIQYWLLRYVG